MRFLSLFFLLFLLFGICSFSQVEHLKKFYPESALYKKLRIKQVVDSSKINPYTVRIREFDTLGRELGDCYDTYKNWDNPYSYQQRGDTLFRLKYREKKQKVYSFEMFIFSRTKKILKYIECRDSYTGDGKKQAQENDFYYDNRDNLICQIHLANLDYSAVIEERMIINTSKLKFFDVIYYTYKKTSNDSLLIIAKHVLDKPAWRVTDTLFYNSQKQLIKESSFAKKGYIGEFLRSNLNRIKESFIERNKITEVEYYIHCFALSTSGVCFDTQKSEIDRRELLLDKKGLTKEEYSYYQSGGKFLTSKYSYTFR